MLETKIYFPIDSQVSRFRQESSGRIVVEEVYQVSQTSEILVLPYATWTQDQNLAVVVAPLEERRKDLQGLVLRGQTLSELPYASVEMNGKLVTHIGGIIGDIWHGILEPALNFTTILEQPKDGQYGVPRENGTTRQMLGLQDFSSILAGAGWSSLVLASWRPSPGSTSTSPARRSTG